MMLSGSGSRNFVPGMTAGGIQKANTDTITPLLLSKGRGTASNCSRGWILGENSSWKGWSGIEALEQGSGGITIPASVQKPCGCGTLGYGLVAREWLDFMILELFSNLNHSMIPDNLNCGGFFRYSEDLPTLSSLGVIPGF